MEKRIIKTTIPLSPTLVNDYCKANLTGDNDILFEFDVSDCPLEPDHIFGYLSNLKVDFRVVGFNDDFFRAYLTTNFYVGSSNMMYHHANLLSWAANGEILYRDVLPELETNYNWFFEENEELVKLHLRFVHALPLFLVVSSDVSDEEKERIAGLYKICGTPVTGMGVNISHLVEFDDVLLRLIGDKVYSFSNGTGGDTYYAHHFDKYLYGGDKLIQTFIDHPDNLLNSAINAMLVR